jgi:selenocysteine lyase/cysteine desulfurase
VTLPSSYVAEFTEDLGYMDFASVGPPSMRVISEVTAMYRRVAQGSGKVATQVLGSYEAALATMARFLGVLPEQVTVIPSTSAGLFQAAFGLIGDGGNVVVPSHEFPANLYPWLRAEVVGGPQVRLVDVPDRRVTAAALSDAIDDETQAVVVSLVDYSSGYRVDLDELRELADDALLIVDAIQGLGCVAQSLAPADVMVGGGVKWMRAGWGSGVFAASPRALDRLEPTLTGWFGVDGYLDLADPVPHEPRDDAERMREGSPSIYGAVAYAAAIDAVEVAGIAAIESAIKAIVIDIEAAVSRAGAEVLTPWRSEAERAGILSFRMPDEDPTETAQRITAAGLTVSERKGWVRVSPHATTDPGAVEILEGAL